MSAKEKNIRHHQTIKEGMIMTLAEQLIQKGREEGLQQGMEQGIQQGMEQGIHQGMERGMHQGMERGLHQGMERGLHQGMERGMQESVIEVLEARFGAVSASIRKRLTSITDRAMLEDLLKKAATVPTLTEWEKNVPQK